MGRLLAFAAVISVVLWGVVCLGQEIGHGYRLISIEKGPDGSLIGSLEVIRSTDTYGPDVPLLQLYVKHETEDRLRVHITDAKKKRWEVPYNLIPRAQVPHLQGRKETKVSKPMFEYVEFSDNVLVFSYIIDPFGFAISRISNGDVLFNSSYGNLVFKDQYLEIATSLPTTTSLYGLGENTLPNGIKIVPNQTYTIYASDIPPTNLYTNLYGAHPFYMDLREGGVAHGVLLLNSNGMDVFYTGSTLTYKIIGGVLDFYFFAGRSPLDVIEQYTSLIGRPAAMPYWAFGFHQCKFGYKNVSDLEYVVDNYNKSQIPLEVMWTDDNYMDGAKDFTLDPINYPKEKLRAFIDRIHANDQKYVIIVDPGISVNLTYESFQRGMASDIFIKHDGEPFMGQVWPGAVYFPDFLNPKTISFWTNEISQFYKIVPVDGLWIDMNEISNFCSGKCTIPNNKTCPGPGVVYTCCLDCTTINDTQWDNPPYKINAFRTHAPIGTNTIATSSTHYNGILEYDAHSLYGFLEAIATHISLQSILNKRPFILSRSTFVGSGSYAAHWTGDNHASWEDLKYSISTILRFGMFGMPMVGADICGFLGGTNEELCARWIQLGSFYPFSRDHSNFDSPRQELYLWDLVAKSARKALGLRYKILPYIYTLNYEAHMTGAPIARPIFFSFPEDEETYDLGTQFLIGPSVLVSPVLQKETSTITAYFPIGSWYSLNNMNKSFISMGEYVSLEAPMDTINVHICDGMILPMQEGGLTTTEARKTPFTLVVSFPIGSNYSVAKAKGHLFLDNGEDVDMKLQEGSSTYTIFFGESDGKIITIKSEVQMGNYAMEKGWMVKHVVVLGPSPFPSVFHVNFPIGKNFSITWDINKINSNVSYQASNPIKIM